MLKNYFLKLIKFVQVYIIYINLSKLLINFTFK